MFFKFSLQIFLCYFIDFIVYCHTHSETGFINMTFQGLRLALEWMVCMVSLFEKFNTLSLNLRVIEYVLGKEK